MRSGKPFSPSTRVLLSVLALALPLGCAADVSGILGIEPAKDEFILRLEEQWVSDKGEELQAPEELPKLFVRVNNELVEPETRIDDDGIAHIQDRYSEDLFIELSDDPATYIATTARDLLLDRSNWGYPDQALPKKWDSTGIELEAEGLLDLSAGFEARGLTLLSMGASMSNFYGDDTALALENQGQLRLLTHNENDPEPAGLIDPERGDRLWVLQSQRGSPEGFHELLTTVAGGRAKLKSAMEDGEFVSAKVELKDQADKVKLRWNHASFADALMDAHPPSELVSTSLRSVVYPKIARHPGRQVLLFVGEPKNPSGTSASVELAYINPLDSRWREQIGIAYTIEYEEEVNHSTWFMTASVGRYLDAEEAKEQTFALTLSPPSQLTVNGEAPSEGSARMWSGDTLEWLPPEIGPADDYTIEFNRLGAQSGELVAVFQVATESFVIPDDILEGGEFYIVTIRARQGVEDPHRPSSYGAARAWATYRARSLQAAP